MKAQPPPYDLGGFFFTKVIMTNVWLVLAFLLIGFGVGIMVGAIAVAVWMAKTFINKF